MATMGDTTIVGKGVDVKILCTGRENEARFRHACIRCSTGHRDLTEFVGNKRIPFRF
jgi:hypothetical protein